MIFKCFISKLLRSSGHLLSITIFSAFVFPAFLYAQQIENPIYGGLAEQKWLPDFSIKDIIQDKNYNIWVATNTGLYRYNINNVFHYDITRYTTDKYLNNQINCLAEADNGDVLVGTQSGLGRFSLSTNTIQLVAARDQSITYLLSASSGRVFYVTDNKDVYKLIWKPLENTYEKELIFRSSDFGKSNIRSAVELGKDFYAIAASDGVWMLKNKKLYPTSIKGPVNVLYKDAETLWVGTSFQGIYKFTIGSQGVDLDGNYKSMNSQGAVESIQQIKKFDKEAVSFATTNNIYITHPTTFPKVRPVKEKALFERNAVQRIFVDKTLNIWIGSRNGLFNLNPVNLHTRFYSFDNTIYQNIIVNDLLMLNKDSVLVATNSAGLALLNRVENRIQGTSSRLRSVKLLRRSPDGNLLVLADNRFVKIHPDKIFNFKDTGTFIEQRGINDVIEIRPGEFWFSHWRRKIIRLNSASTDPHTDELFRKVKKALSEDAHVSALTIDSRNNLWIGTRGDGLMMANPKTLEITRFERQDNYPEQIMCIIEDSKSRLWVGTRDKGLLLYIPETNNFQTFNHLSGLPSNTISAIQENENGDLWISTLNGIAKLHEGKIISFRAYNKESGIYNAEFSFNIADSHASESVFLGTESGIYELSKKANKFPEAPLEWTNIDLIKGSAKNIEQMSTEAFSNKMLSYLKEQGAIELEYNQNSVQIGFSKLDYSLPKQSLYIYRLNGYDSTWTVLQGEKSKVQYFNLPPGEYVFQVMASTSNDIWDNAAKSFVIVVKPSIWLTTTAKALYLLLAILFVVAAYKMILRWRRLNLNLKEKTESARLYDQKMVYYTDLSHEIKNRLTLILGPLEDALKNKKINYQLLNRIYEQGQHLKRFSDQIMNIRKNELGDFLLTVSLENISTIISKIVEDSKPLGVIKGINIKFAASQDNIMGWCDAEILEIISMNVVNNALKYCRPNGSVEISLSIRYMERDNSLVFREGNYLSCTITDTGIGIAEEEISKIVQPFYRAQNVFDNKEISGKGIGLDLVSRLTKKHYGFLEIVSELGDFTAVSFYLPIDRQAFSVNEIRPDVKTQPIVINEKNFHAPQSLIFPNETSQTSDKLIDNKKHRLLIVDDDYEILDYLTEIFKDEFSLLTADSVSKAFDLVKYNKVDLIVCDLDMPGDNGLTFCTILKSNSEYAQIPFILLTGRNSEEQKLIAFKNGVVDFVDKPFSSELLSWRIKSILKTSAGTVKVNTVVVTEPLDIIRETATEKFIQDVIDIIEAHIDKDYLSVDYLADEMFMSRATFYRKMEEMFGETPSTFIRKYRLKKALIYIQNGNYSLKQISDRVGFKTPNYFSKCFKNEFGVLPSDYHSPSIIETSDL